MCAEPTVRVHGQIHTSIRLWKSNFQQSEHSLKIIQLFINFYLSLNKIKSRVGVGISCNDGN